MSDEEEWPDERPLVEHLTDFLAEAMPGVRILRLDEDGPKPETIVVPLDATVDNAAVRDVGAEGEAG